MMADRSLEMHPYGFKIDKVGGSPPSLLMHAQNILELETGYI